MSISEQVKELRYNADIYNTVGSAWELNRAEAKKLQAMLREAADTIESLSAKLQAAHMERSADCGGWIPCKDKPQRKRNESSRPVLVRYKDETAIPEVCVYNFLTEKFVFIEKDVSIFVKEWREIPGYEP